MRHRELREQVARTAREMSASGLVTGTSGNVSSRTQEGEVLIIPSGVDYGQLEPSDVALASYATYGTEELAGYAGETLDESRNACLLKNHGTIAVGTSTAEAFSRTIILEEMAEIYYRTRVVGEPVLLTEDQVDEVAAKIADYGQAKPTASDGG